MGGAAIPVLDTGLQDATCLVLLLLHLQGTARLLLARDISCYMLLPEASCSFSGVGGWVSGWMN